MTADLSRLAELAKAATPGPWKFEPAGDFECGEPGCCSDYWDDRVWAGGVVLMEPIGYVETSDVKFIAAASPDVILDLLARLQQAEATVARVTALRDEYANLARDESYGGEPWSTTECTLTAALAPTTEEAL